MAEGEKLIPINIEEEMKSATSITRCRSLCHVPCQMSGMV